MFVFDILKQILILKRIIIIIIIVGIDTIMFVLFEKKNLIIPTLYPQ